MFSADGARALRFAAAIVLAITATACAKTLAGTCVSMGVEVIK